MTQAGVDRDSKSKERGIRTDWQGDPPPVTWRRSVGEGYASVAVVGERVFHFGREGGNERLSCLSSSTGDTIWSKEHKVDYADVFGYGDGPRATPLVDGDRVYSYGVRGTLNCYRVSNAEELWNIDTERMLGAEPGMYGFGSTPIIDGDKLLLIAGGGEGADGTGHGIVALDKYDGALCYSVTADLASCASPQVATIGSRRLCFALVREWGHRIH